MLDKIFELSKQSKKYKPEAYVFVNEVLQWAVEELSNLRHITGKELTRAAFIYSVTKYGLLARTVWEQLGLHGSEDLGQVVFQMVDAKLMGKQPDDKIEDFDGLLTIEDFDKVEMVAQGIGGKWKYIQGEDPIKIGYKPPEGLGTKLS